MQWPNVNRLPGILVLALFACLLAYGLVTLRQPSSKTGARKTLSQSSPGVTQEARAAHQQKPGHDLAQKNPAAPSALPVLTQPGAEAVQPQHASATNNGHDPIAIGLILCLAMILVFIELAPRFADFLNSRYDPWAAVDEAAEQVSAEVQDEDKSFLDFVTLLRAGPAPRGVDAMLRSLDDEASEDALLAESNALKDYFDSAPEALYSLNNLLSEIGLAPTPEDRQEILSGLLTQVHCFTLASGLPELMPVWQLACALEGLLKQLTDKPCNVNPSTLRTAAAAVVLLDTLTIRGLNPDLAINPSVRLLVVDDDPISSTAVASALKKVFNLPDLASNGEAALALAVKNSYDVIFLDVKMPGMDGFELCRKIHQTAANPSTPVVFVTGHSDFDSRAKSNTSGGQDLIAKPFLSFEIAVKALTFVLSSRFQRQAGMTPAPAQASSPSLAAGQSPAISAASQPSSQSTTAPTVAATGNKPAGDSPLDLDTAHYSKAFFAQAPLHLEALRSQLHSLIYAADGPSRHDILGALYVSIHSLTCQAERAELPVAARLSSSLEALLKKLLDNRKYVTPSALDAAASALDLLLVLCDDAINPGLTSPVRILVVDDDPIARRTISAALQISFGKPDTADNGEEAVAAAAQKAFDVIFLDVQMPGMDGYDAAAKIHETSLNSRTPVVFVTSSGDMDSRAKAGLAGGAGFIPKPPLPSEIALRALTFALRSRLGAPERSPVEEPEAVLC